MYYILLRFILCCQWITRLSSKSFYWRCIYFNDCKLKLYWIDHCFTISASTNFFPLKRSFSIFVRTKVRYIQADIWTFNLKREKRDWKILMQVVNAFWRFNLLLLEYRPKHLRPNKVVVRQSADRRIFFWRDSIELLPHKKQLQSKEEQKNLT